MPQIKYIDLWADQVDSPSDEYPFPLPAVFLEFNAPRIDDLGENVQDLYTEIKVYLLYIPAGDIYQGATGRDDITRLRELLTGLYRLLHGTGGENFSQTTRISLHREKAAPFEWLYSQAFSTIIRDYSGCKAWKNEETSDNILIEQGLKSFQ